MSDDREQPKDGDMPPVSEEREVEINRGFIENLIWRGNDTCIEGIPSKDRRNGPIVKQPNKEELFTRYKNECSDIRRCLYSIATTPELLSKADNLSDIINEALEIARSFLRYNTQPHDFNKKFEELAPKWDSAIVGFFSRVNQDSETPQPDTKAVVIDSSKYSKSKSFNMLTDLINDVERKGVHCPNKRELKTLKELLKKHGDEDVAEALTWADDNIKLNIPFGQIVITPRK